MKLTREEVRRLIVEDALTYGRENPVELFEHAVKWFDDWGHDLVTEGKDWDDTHEESYEAYLDVLDEYRQALIRLLPEGVSRSNPEMSLPQDQKVLGNETVAVVNKVRIWWGEEEGPGPGVGMDGEEAMG
jgi:hypothetical protein